MVYTRINASTISLILIVFCLSIDFNYAQTNKPNNNNNSNTLCIDPSLVQQAAKSDGISDPKNPDKFAKSATSNNNFIQFCAGHKLTNGQQVSEGSCNPTPMGLIPSSKKMPSVRIVSPTPTTKIAAHKEFDVVIASRNIQLGSFTSPENTYYLAPQQLNKKGLIIGHLHLVIQLIHDNQPPDPLKFVFFKGVADSAVNGKVDVTITDGLPDGIYRISTITAAMNHQPATLSIAKRGAVDDALYITIGTGKSSPLKAGGESGGSTTKGKKVSEASKKNIKGEENEKGSDSENTSS